jgi:23S rRNA (uracil1939-C5)-methyltransferase
METSSSSSARAVASADRGHLVIDHVGHRGDGVARADGSSVFVPYTLRGEAVEVAPVAGHPDRGRLLRIERASTERIPPFCRYFGGCGGCAIQHWQAEAYRAWKRQIVVDTLSQAGIECEVEPLVDAHGAGRRRMTVHARRGSGGEWRVGFAEASSHAIVAIDDCPILDPALHGAFDACRALAEILKPAGKPLDIQLTAASNGLDVDIRGSGPLPPPTVESLACAARQHGLIRLTRHGELVLMRTPPVLAIGPAQLALPPGAFLQATAAGEEALAVRVAAHCDRAKSVADLFCGIGPFALRLAAKARVAAFDSDPGAVAALQKAASATLRLKPVRAEVRDLFRRPLVPQELRDYDTVVFDPPRQGALAQVQQLAASRIATVVAVSCNVATFARDARILIDGGYRIERVVAIDQFRHTPHVELVARFKR